MSFAALPPESNSALMYAGPGSAPLVAAASAWDSLAAELHTTASTYRSVIAGLTTERWIGPSSLSMASALGPYVAWTVGAAARAAETASQASLAVEAYETAFAATVPPQAVAANRAQFALLVASNVFGQNTAAIAATEAEYGEMWAQDTAAMFGYASASAEASQLTQFTTPPEVTNTAGLAAQGAATAQSASASIGGGVQSALSDLMSSISTTLQNLVSPLVSGFGTTTVSNPLTGLSSSGLEQTLVAEYAFLPGYAALILGANALGPLFNPAAFLPFANLASAAAPAAQVVGATAPATGAGFAENLASLAGLGQAGSVGELTVPASWGWTAAATPAGIPIYTLASAASPLEAADFGALGGAPLMFGPLSRAAAVGAGAGAVAGAAAARFGPRPKMVGRSSAAGYSDESPLSPIPQAAKYPAPTGVPANVQAPPGYRPAIVYVPVDGPVSADE